MPGTGVSLRTAGGCGVPGRNAYIQLEQWGVTHDCGIHSFVYMLAAGGAALAKAAPSLYLLPPNAESADEAAVQEAARLISPKAMLAATSPALEALVSPIS